MPISVKNTLLSLSWVALVSSCKEGAGSFRGSNAVLAPTLAPTVVPANPAIPNQTAIVSPQVTPYTPPEAVTKGSFSAWTEPKDPSPGQDYRIIIQVTLPSNTTSYSENDLSGQVIGTDQYRQPIGASANASTSSTIGGKSYDTYYKSGQFQHNGTSAKLSVLVPGAAKLVQDTIQIKSSLLNESQELTIVF